MSLPVTNHWTSVSIRRNRKSFLLANLILICLFAFVGSLIGFLVFISVDYVFYTHIEDYTEYELNTVMDSALDEALGIVIIPLTIPAVCFSCLLTAQRLRDFNVTGWWSLIWIPVTIMSLLSSPPYAEDYGIVYILSIMLTFVVLTALCVMPGTVGPNKYGNDPLQK